MVHYRRWIMETSNGGLFSRFWCIREQSTKHVKELKNNSNPSNPGTKVNKVAQKPTPRVPHNKKSEGGSRHAKKDNEGMKVTCNFCG